MWCHQSDLGTRIEIFRVDKKSASAEPSSKTVWKCNKEPDVWDTSEDAIINEKPAWVVTQRAKRKRDQLSPVVENDDASESLVNSIVDSLVPAFLHAFKDKLASDANLTVNNHNAIAVETNNTFHSNANVEAT